MTDDALGPGPGTPTQRLQTPTSPRRLRSSYYSSRLLLPQGPVDARRLWHVYAVQVAGGVHPIKFDARGGWNTGFLTCAAWLTWRVGLDPGAARERVRVARALGTLPRLAQALSRGELSYAKVRAGGPALPRTSSGSFVGGDGWTGWPRPARPRGATGAGRCTCIRTRTA
ncbi:MAG: DUF222 domain-containing protein [Deltaproteobacteria bacterium]|nr:MAG: DUF222 domain-containing protein [Deltaproteobacteria bacterium]